MAPPVYRPQSATLAQSTFANGHPQAVSQQTPAARTAPFVYRPQLATLASPNIADGRSQATARQTPAAGTAPPVYRPQAGKSAQASMAQVAPQAAVWQTPVVRAAPPVYRPQAAASARPTIVQGGSQATAQRMPALRAAPPVYRPQDAAFSKPVDGATPLGAPRAHVVQPYFTITNANLAAANADIATGNATFTGQDKIAGSFRSAGAEANLSASAAPDLRVSDDGKMAIEETNLNTRQAKVFYAEESVIKDSNVRLKAANSYYRLVKNSNVFIHVPDGAGALRRTSILKNRRKLYQVTPKNTTEAGVWRSGIRMRSAQSCNTMAAEVCGAGTEDGQHPQLTGGLYAINSSFLAEDRIARFATSYLATGNAATATVAANYTVATAAEVATKRKEIAKAYGPAAALGAGAPGSIDPVASQLGINQYSDVQVGGAYSTFSIGAKKAGRGVKDYTAVGGPAYNADPWGYHWGGVVARSGGDTVTLENYVRGKEDVALAAASLSEERYFFQMYGPHNRATVGGPVDQSWHAAWKHSDFANAITIPFRH